MGYRKLIRPTHRRIVLHLFPSMLKLTFGNVVE